MYIFWIWTYLLQVLFQCSAEKDLQNVACRSYLGVHDRVDQYRINAYSSCFIFLFYQLNPRINSNYSEGQPVVDFIYKRQIKQLESWDYVNDTVKSNVCSFLSRDECQRWILCCEAADNCCEYQLALPVKTNDTCGRIWDGWLCWEEAEPGTVQYSSCPLFVPYFMPSRQAVRICGDDGKWIQKTDYSPCLKKEELERTIFTGLGCSITSIVFLLPSIIIFLKYKTLRNQHRIRLHINLFLSLMLKEVMEILWDILVTYNKVTSTEVSDATLIKNGVGCKFLSFMKIYFKCCGYTWMFCEGFYLHRLMSNAFSPPRSLLPIYILGWSVPLVSSSIYGILRGIYNNESTSNTTVSPYFFFLHATVVGHMDIIILSGYLTHQM